MEERCYRANFNCQANNAIDYLSTCHDHTVLHDIVTGGIEFHHQRDTSSLFTSPNQHRLRFGVMDSI